MSKPVCLVTAPVATRSGYGAHGRDICRALIKLDKYDVKIWPVRWGNTPMNALNKDDPNDKMIIDRILPNPQLPKQPELHIHIVIPNEFQTFGKYNIGITAGLEMTACPPGWLEGMNKMNMNIVPSTFVKDMITNIKFDINNEQDGKKVGELKSDKPIEVLFEGTDTNIFKKTNEFSKEFVDEMKKVKESFNFLYVGHWLQGDLGKDRKDTGMMLKVFLETFKNLKQKPVIATNWSGHLDFLNKNLAVLVGGGLQNVEKGSVPDEFLTEGAQWFTVNYQEASAKMKDVYKSYKKYTLDAKKLGTVNKSKFSLNAMTKELGKILDKYVPEFPKEVKLELPKLKKVGSTDLPKIKLPKLKKV